MISRTGVPAPSASQWIRAPLLSAKSMRRPPGVALGLARGADSINRGHGRSGPPPARAICARVASPSLHGGRRSREFSSADRLQRLALEDRLGADDLWAPDPFGRGDVDARGAGAQREGGGEVAQAVDDGLGRQVARLAVGELVAPEADQLL